jgi:hypothetical protein
MAIIRRPSFDWQECESVSQCAIEKGEKLQGELRALLLPSRQFRRHHLARPPLSRSQHCLKMVLAGGEFAYGSLSMPIQALPSSAPKSKRRAVAGAMVIALVAVCALICTFFVSRMDSDHSLQQHAFNPMIGDLASAKAKLATPDAVPLPPGFYSTQTSHQFNAPLIPFPVSARTAVQSDKVARLHERLSKVAAAAVSSSPTPVHSAAVKTAAAKPASPDDDAIVAALKATLDKEEKDAEQKVVSAPPVFSSPPCLLPPTRHVFLRRKRGANKRAQRSSRNFTTLITSLPPLVGPPLPRRPTGFQQLLRRRASRILKLLFESALLCSLLQFSNVLP